MSPTDHRLLLKITANTAAADPNCTAVALAELPAALVSFRWQQPSLPLTQNANSAASPVLAARHFSGNCAICAVNALTTAIFVSFSASGGMSSPIHI
jgi:hypothetical protein